jgi:hypothetical protein
MSDKKILCACGCGKTDRMTPSQYLENYYREQGIKPGPIDETVYKLVDGQFVEFAANLDEAIKKITPMSSFDEAVARLGLTVPPQIN